MQLEPRWLDRARRGNRDAGTGVDWAQWVNAVEYLAGAAVPELARVERGIDRARCVPIRDLSRIGTALIEDGIENVISPVFRLGGKDRGEISLYHSGRTYDVIDISKARGEIGGDALLKLLVEAIE